MERVVTIHLDKNHALILGAGYSAKHFIPALIAQGFSVTATTRTPANFATLSALGAKPIIYDGAPSQTLLDALALATHILSSVPPNSKGDPFIQSLKTQNLTQIAPHTRWVGYLSATSVYGDRKGQWVFEDELLYPQTQRGKNRTQAELDWLETGLPVHIFRLAGIYGPNRTPFKRLKSGSARAVIKDGHIVNRIHVDDIAQALWLSVKHPKPLQIYNLSDDRPAPPQAVLEFAADLIGAERPKKVAHDHAELSDMARSFYTETKRVSNQRAKDHLGWKPLYPNYKLGLMAALKAELGLVQGVLLSGYIDVPTEHLKSVLLGLPTHIRLSNQEKDCVYFHIRQDPDRPTRFHISEAFKDITGFTRHQARMKNSEWAQITKTVKRTYQTLGF